MDDILKQRCGKIRLLLSDVDGVLTDGRIVLDNQGIETKRFSIRDGLGVKLWQKAGHRFGIITGRTSRIVQTRAAELGIDLVRQGFEDKLPVAQEIMELLGLTPEEVCYIGDDLPDLPVIRRVGLGVAVADADAAVQNASDHATTTPGGAGAVRELIETILKQQGRWDHLVQKYF